MTGNIIEIIGMISGVIYIILEILKKNSMWVVGVITAAAYIALFAMEGLYASMSVQIYYFAVSFYGIVQWRRLEDSNTSDAILLKKLSLKEVSCSLLVTAASYFLLRLVLLHFTSDPHPELDTLVTVLSMLGTYWLTRSYIRHWYVWILTNGVSIVLYLFQGLYLTSVLYLIYLLSAVFGLYYWRKKGIVVNK